MTAELEAPAVDSGSAPGSQAWESKTIDLGVPVHYGDFGGSGQVLVLVHGIASSHLNWMGVGEELARRYRVVAVDLPGYGLSPRGDQPVTVENSQVYLDRFIDAVSPRAPVLLFGHSMGGLVSMLQAHHHPEKVSQLVLLAPAAPYPRRSLLNLMTAPFLVAVLMPRRSASLMRRGGQRVDPDRVVRDIMRRIVAPSSSIPEHIMQAHIDLLRRQRAEHDWNEQALVESAASLVKTTARRRRFRAMVAGIQAPTLLMHGTRDRLVPYGSGVALARMRPTWSWRPLAGLGHMAQMENPGLLMRTLNDWLAAQAILAR